MKVPKDFKSVRSMFGDDEESYIMDAKQKGNIGRFLNHSCYPNVVAQNVFVDSHDLRKVSPTFLCLFKTINFLFRFPWLAFFSSTYIKAGQELCWDYGYEVTLINISFSF